MGRPRKYTNAELLERIRTLARELGRTPTCFEATPHFSVYRTRFGSWRDACIAAGIVPRAHGGSRMPPAPPKALAVVRRAEELRAYWSTRGLVA